METESLEYTEEELRLKSNYVIKIKLKVPSSTQLLDSEHSEKLEKSQEASSSSSSAPKRPRLKIAFGPSPVTDSFPLEYDAKFDLLNSDWDSSKAEIENSPPLNIELPGLELELTRNPETKEYEVDETKKNTLVVFGTLPTGSDGFMFCLGTSSSSDFTNPETNFFYCFDVKNQAIIQNSFKDKTWSNDLDTSVKGMPIQRDKPFELRLVLCEQGIALYLNQKFMSEFGYRPENLVESGMPVHFFAFVKHHDGFKGQVIVHRVWWGNTIPYVTSSKKLAFS